MTYQSFINFLTSLETKNVKAIPFLNSCATTQIPNSFLVLFPEIIKFLHKHLNEFCHENEIIGIFGLQITAHNLKSNLPKQLNRIAYLHSPSEHFCCNLNFLVSNQKTIKAINNWHGYKSLIIDFTTGEIMNPEQYIYLLAFTDKAGKIYGKLSQKSL